MGAKVPREIRVEVIRKWLQGITRDMIANEVCIGAGTVSGIIGEYKRDDPDADLLREVALWIKHEGMDIQSFAPLVRLREVLKQQEWIVGIRSEQGDGGLDHETEKKMESLIMSVEVICFKQNLTAKEFFDSINKMYLAAKKLGTPIEEFPNYVQELGAKQEILTADNTKRENEELRVKNQKLTQQVVKAEMEARECVVWKSKENWLSSARRLTKRS
jgi:hypothetical protein